MNPPPQLPSRRTLIDFAAYVACHHKVEGPKVRRLMRLVERYRKGIDDGPALADLHAAIHETLPRGNFTFAGPDVYVDGHLIP
jgi:hypothetical protein